MLAFGSPIAHAQCDADGITVHTGGADAMALRADVVVNMLGATPSEIRVLPAVAGLRRYPAILAEVRHMPHRNPICRWPDLPRWY